jgi:hypothetical protein
MFPKDATWIVICCNNNYFRLFIISENLEFLPKKVWASDNAGWTKSPHQIILMC